MKRAALVLIAAIGAGVVLGPGPAGAGESSDDTVVTSQPLPGGGYVLEVTAVPGQANNLDILITVPDTHVGIRDTGPGATDDSPKCEQVDAETVECKRQGLRRVNVDTGDRDDTVGLAHEGCDPFINEWHVIAGRGDDRVDMCGRGEARGGRGEDRLVGRRRNQQLFGGRNADRITAGRGSHDHCDGQAGNDSGGGGCETKISL